MPNLSTRDLLYDRLRTDLFKKLVRLQFRRFRTVEGTEHPGHVISPGVFEELVTLLRVPLNPPGVLPNPRPGWGIPNGCDQSATPFASSADEVESLHRGYDEARDCEAVKG
jgi:hypothetical protein